jgi:glycerol-3-phosphate O-acyltransferase
MTPEFHALFYFKYGFFIARMYLRFMYRVRIGQQPDHLIEDIPADSSVVIVGNHRSNVDVMILAYLAARTNMISFAAGEWANVWPMSAVLHMSGSYIVRRDSSDPLYRRLLAIHVQELIRVKMPQGIFPEGELTRDGSLQPFKLGLLSYLLASLSTNNVNDIVFLPVAFNYDQTPEDRTLIRQEKEGFAGKSRFYSLIGTATYLARFLVRKLQRGKVAYGNAAVNFAQPLSIKQWLASQGINMQSLNDEQRYAIVSPVGKVLFQRISQIVPVLPVSVVATAIVNSGEQAFDETKLRALAEQSLDAFQENHAVIIQNNDQTTADFIQDGLDVLITRRVLEVRNDLLSVRADRNELLMYYYHSTRHLLGR